MPIHSPILWVLGSSLRVKRLGPEAGYPAIPLFPLYAIMTWTEQLDAVAIMTVRERGVGNIFWLFKDVMWQNYLVSNDSVT
jgi:hypothetical protein